MGEPTPGQPRLNRTTKEHRSWGTLESVEEIVTDENGRDVERTVRNPAGELLNQVRFIRDADGRLTEEFWEEYEEGRVRKGKYVYTYGEDGAQVDKVWQNIE